MAPPIYISCDWYLVVLVWTSGIRPRLLGPFNVAKSGPVHTVRLETRNQVTAASLWNVQNLFEKPGDRESLRKWICQNDAVTHTYKRSTVLHDSIGPSRLPTKLTSQCPTHLKNFYPPTNTISAMLMKTHMRVVTELRISRFSLKESIALPMIRPSWLVFGVVTFDLILTKFIALTVDNWAAPQWSLQDQGTWGSHSRNRQPAFCFAYRRTSSGWWMDY